MLLESHSWKKFLLLQILIDVSSNVFLPFCTLPCLPSSQTRCIVSLVSTSKAGQVFLYFYHTYMYQSIFYVFFYVLCVHSTIAACMCTYTHTCTNKTSSSSLYVTFLFCPQQRAGLLLVSINYQLGSLWTLLGQSLHFQ